MKNLLRGKQKHTRENKTVNHTTNQNGELRKMADQYYALVTSENRTGELCMKVDHCVNISVENGACPRVASGVNSGDNIGLDGY